MGGGGVEEEKEVEGCAKVGRKRNGWMDTDGEKWAWRERALLVPAAVLCREPIHHAQINYKERRGNKGVGGVGVERIH